MDELPVPFVSVDIDVRALDSFMLNVEQMLASELWALSTGEEFKAAFSLWMRAWKQIPAGSLPKDEKILAAFSGSGRRWKNVREMALRGFVECSDGRLYHKVLCGDVRRAAQKMAERHERTKAATEARKRLSSKDRDVNRNELRDDERDVLPTVKQKGNVTTPHRQGQGRKKEEESKPASGEALFLIAPSPDARVYEFGKTLLGKSSGGQVTKLLKHFGGDPDRAMVCLKTAAQKNVPAEYIGAVLRGNGVETTDDVIAETDRLYEQWNVE